MAQETSDQDSIKAAVISAPQESSEDGMHSSMMTPSEAMQTQEESIPAPEPSGQSNEQQTYTEPYSQTGYQNNQPAYPQYQQSYSMSPDTITEISEQVASEKLSQIKDELEKILDFRSTIESKISYLDERLKKIEKIIDRLQLSVLQKVGEYVNNVSDLKNEVVETQKSFKSLLDKHKTK